MSIIYDALQKTQQRLDDKETVLNHNINSSRWLLIILILLVTTLLFLTIWGMYKNNYIFQAKSLPYKKANLVKEKTNQKNILSQQKRMNAIAQENSNLQLQGVFVSDQERIAIINNKLLHIGDSINGKKLISIEFNQVKLQETDRILTL